MSIDLPSARTLLFVPGARPDRFAKALASGADLVCIDLEDATAVALKESARRQTVEFLSSQSDCKCFVRINSLRRSAGLEDVLALKNAGSHFGVALAKVEAANELEIVHAILGSQIPMLAVLESTRSIERVFEIAAAPGCIGLMLGGADYCAELGATMTRESLAYPRSRLLAAAACQRLASVDVPHFDLNDAVGLAEQTRHSQSQGFSCISAIHPKQIAEIHRLLQPSAVDVRRAQDLLHAAKQSLAAAFVFEDKMIDRPLVLAAQRILRNAGIAFDQ